MKFKYKNINSLMKIKITIYRMQKTKNNQIKIK